MKWINRFYENEFNSLIKPGKVFVLYGPRRVGKSSLINKYLTGKNNIFKSTGEDFDLKALMEKPSLNALKLFFSDYEIIFIDEVQYIGNVGISLKMMIDSMPEKIIIVTGSSSFNISSEISEPLTGRQTVRVLYPLSVSEIKNDIGAMSLYQKLDELLVYGTYPETYNISNKKDKTEYLNELRNSYLFKDILSLENIKNPGKLVDLLKLLSFQVGSEVSLNELSRKLSIAKKTVERYLDLLEKAFIIISLSSYSGNLRNEIAKSKKYYFIDNGIRNAIINNFLSVSARNDTGALWENFIISEKIKNQVYKREYSNNYFWRTYEKQEIDFIEEKNGKLYAYEIKWSVKNVKIPELWKKTYKESEFYIINKENFLSYF